MEDIKIKGFIVNGRQYELDLEISVGKLVAPNGKEYELKVDNKGNLYTYSESVTPIPAPTGGEVTAITPNTVSKLYINSLYCGGGNANEHTINYCSHNFVELANLTTNDINLNGMYLQYAEKGSGWAKLPLKGIIKAGSTFLIRGAQCSVMDSSLTKIKVENYDMEWLNNDGTLIKFSTDDAKFYLCFGEFTGANPYIAEGPKVVNGYIDLIGIKGSNGQVDASESSPYDGNPMNEKLFKKYYSMDPVSQATKDVSARKNNTLWNYVDLTKNSGDVIPNIEDYTPRASFEGKNIFYNKTKLFEDKPSMITCSFGIQATDSGNGATRCFNWLSKGLFDEFIWIKAKGSNDWGTANESFKNEEGIRQYYNRKTREYSDNIVMTAHKFIKKGLVAGEYEYIAGHKNADGTPNLELCTPVRSFKVRATEDVENGFTFVQTSDQQGFNWDEYNVWSATANIIKDEDVDNAIEFMINTGDMTQNGNRIGEWLDYFNGKNDYLNNKEEMAIIGNNDLSPRNLYKLGNGADNNKLSLENIEFFYCFEMDEENPPVFTVNSVPYYIPSLYSFNYGNVHFLCMNSEIKVAAEFSADGTSVYQFDSAGNFYPQIKTWCENDMEKNSGFTWNVAYCHEMPFTILTTGVTYADNVTTNTEVFEGGDGRQGANMNINLKSKNDRYWFSEFCQTHNIRLVFGGHKHTQSTSWPILENVKYEDNVRKPISFRPIIVLSNDNWLAELKEIAGDAATELVTLTDGRKYPNNWILNGEINPTYSGNCFFCEFKLESDLEDGVCPVVYAMSQATSYKHTSNKELPANNIPWLRYCYGTAKNTTKPDNGQKFPFYTIWTITNNKIEGKVRKGYGIFNAGNYDVNIQGYFVRQGKCATDNEHDINLHSVNGIKPSASNEIIEIVK